MLRVLLHLVPNHRNQPIPPTTMTTPSKPEELLETAEKEAGKEAMQMLVDKHLDNLMALREQMPIEDIDLLSSNIASNKRVDKAVKDHITSLHAKMRKLVETVAQRIENQKYKSSEEVIEGIRSMKMKERAVKLLSADKLTHVSCQSLKVAVELFFELNKQIVARLESSTIADPAEETKLLLGNALLVYELTDFAIGFLEGFRLNGIEEIEDIYKEMQRTISVLREEAKSLRKKAESPDIDENLKDQVIRDITNRDEAVEVLEKEWTSYIQTVRSDEGEVGVVKKKIPSLRLIRDNARAQIDTLAAVSVLKIVQSNIRAIEATVIQLEKIQLASLSADRVKRLLGPSRS